MKPIETYPRKSGTQAMIGALLAVLGAVAAANPGNAVVMAIAEAAPVLAETVPTLLTACGAIIAAFSTPPTLGGQAKR